MASMPSNWGVTGLVIGGIGGAGIGGVRAYRDAKAVTGLIDGEAKKSIAVQALKYGAAGAAAGFVAGRGSQLAANAISTRSNAPRTLSNAGDNLAQGLEEGGQAIAGAAGDAADAAAGYVAHGLEETAHVVDGSTSALPKSRRAAVGEFFRDPRAKAAAAVTGAAALVTSGVALRRRRTEAEPVEVTAFATRAADAEPLGVVVEQTH